MADDMSHESIRRVKKRIEEELLALPNVHAVDIGEKVTDGKPTGELSIVVYVDQKKNVAAKNTVPPVVDGVKTDVQEEEPDVLHPALIKLADDELLVDTTRYTTLEGGMSIGPCRSIYMVPPDVATAGWYITVGTLGVIVRDNTTNDAMALTNFHVAAVDDTWTVGDAMAQPARNDGGSCPTDRFGQLERGVLSANVDGAVISIDSRPHNCEILDIGDVAGTRAATVGMAVRKRGRTTELTHGEVISVDYTTTINYGDGLGSVTLVDQVRIAVKAPSTMFGTNGDSGSVVVDDDRKVVGLYFAGNSAGTRGVANPIAKVLSELDVKLCSNKTWHKEIHKEYIKTELPEDVKWHLKWEKPEKEKFEKEKQEKLEWEGPIKRFAREKGHVEKGARGEGFDLPPDFRPPEYGAGPMAGAASLGTGWPDPWATPTKNFFDKPWPEVYDPKGGLKDKEEWKENKNEQKEMKEIKEHKDSKDQKDKETAIDIPPGGFTVDPGGRSWVPPRGSPPGTGFHFIPPGLRPDLGKGALRNEQY